MNEDRITGQRAGIRWCLAWLHKQAASMNDPHATTVLNVAAYQMSVDAKALRQNKIAPSEGWQDIATAPRDGTWVWGFWPYPQICDQQIATVWNGSRWMSPDDDEDWVFAGKQPTHWMPLPPPPDTADDITKED